MIYANIFKEKCKKCAFLSKNTTFLKNSCIYEKLFYFTIYKEKGKKIEVVKPLYKSLQTNYYQYLSQMENTPHHLIDYISVVNPYVLH